jgi:methylmalonyl-CoA/ethylmalonyl-CoA epimerase
VEENIMQSPFRTLHHVCIVVHDIDKAVAYYESIGIGPFEDYPDLTEYNTNLQVPSPEAFHGLKYKLVNLDNFQIQLCQPPHLDCPQRRFLDEHGEGVFHLGFEFDVDDAVATAGEPGVNVLMRGQRPDGTGFVYFDTRDDAGVVLLARRTP